MKGEITVKNPDGKIFRGFVEVDSDMLLKEATLSGKEEGLIVEVRSDRPGQLTCLVNVEGVGIPTKRMVSFNFDGIEGTEIFKVTGRDFGTGKFVRWACSFQQPKN